MQDFLSKMKGSFAKITAKQPSYERKILRPMHDWMLIFIAAFVAMLCCAAIAYYFYVRVDSGKLFTVPAETVQSEVKINESLLKKTLDDFDARAAAQAKAKQGVAPADPSR
jgi:hypothetical protein